jgi:hypothetical protein
MMRLFSTIVLVLVAACDDDSTTLKPDMTVVTPPSDLAMPEFDLTPPAACSPVDPMTDGQSCTNGCPPNTTGVVGQNGECKCWQKCDPASPTVCPCNRRCASLLSGDGGAAGGACLIANGPGERCGAFGTGMSAEGCGQGLICINADEGGQFRYCAYDCSAGQGCPLQTTCSVLIDPTTNTPTGGKACAYLSVQGGILPGQPCQAADACIPNSVCDTTCRIQCDRLGATCGAGTCTALMDGALVIAYVCK